MIVEKLIVQGFKSIESVELDLGNVNVFIGANGSGKSNLLEAFGALAAAAFGRVDSESLVRRGGRLGGFFRPLFRDSPAFGETVLEAEGANSCYRVSLAAPESSRSTGWEFRREIWKGGDEELVNRTAGNGAKGDPQAGLAALKLAETAPDTDAARFLKRLAHYAIYSPETLMLRGVIPDPQTREPVGLSGGRLAQAVSELMDAGEPGARLGKEIQEAVEWFGGFGIMRTRVENDPRSEIHGLAFIDKYFRTEDPETKKGHHYFMSPMDVNEGVLYEMFMGVLCLHPSAPKLLAIDNGDHGLNPLLAKHLIGAVCRWLLESERPRQLLMTTHNPLVLDGLLLQDDRVRLFTVDRDNRGATRVRRFVISDQHREMAEKGWTLSRMWVNKLIGGVPDV